MKDSLVTPEPARQRAGASRIRIRIDSGAAVVTARRKARELAGRRGFSPIDQTMIATAISELARNIVLHAGSGEIVVRGMEGDNGRNGIVVKATDKGPGIPDIGQALESGYSSAGGLGLGLGGIKRLMDEFEIDSEAGRGTTIRVTKWR